MKSGRKILVLGGTSYFGKYLVDMLINNGDLVTLATRGNSTIPAGCSFIKFNRCDNSIFPDESYWDVVYDQSCYHSSYLNGMEKVIRTCGAYIMTSSQAVYPAGFNWDENAVQYDDINVSEYGIEKLKAEKFISTIKPSAIFPRFPTIIGIDDPRRRLQNIIENLCAGEMNLPVQDPLFHIIDAHDAANALFMLPFGDLKGAVNIAANQILDPKTLCNFVERQLNIKVNYAYQDKFKHEQFDLIKAMPKTLNLSKQANLAIKFKGIAETISDICDATKCRISYKH